MQYTFSSAELINTLFIAGGIGICILCILQITASIHLRKEVRGYFQAFFLMLLIYISSHLARQIMNGVPGEGVRTALYIVTFAEMIAAGFMAHMMSLLILYVAKLEKKVTNILGIVLYLVLLAHIVILVVGWPNDLIYYFDGNNGYNRAPAYLLSNAAPVIMLIIDTVLLIVSRKKIEKRLNIALWNYMIAPIISIAIQSFNKDI